MSVAKMENEKKGNTTKKENK